jgi:3-methyladenine DNA glycosylase AlkD
MKAREARELGKQIATIVQSGQVDEAYALLAPVLAERTPFRILDHIGEAVGTGSMALVNDFLERIASEKTQGGWVVIATALGQQLDRNLVEAFARCHGFIISADIWYAADTFGERVLGPALVNNFEPTLDLLAAWRKDANRWIRRTVGVAVHFWAKRSRGAPELAPQAKALLAFVAPMFEEKKIDAVKGIGWGLKTLGRHYPETVTDWLIQQVVHLGCRPRALMLRKALTYLSNDQRARVRGGMP